jgi:hypothetical protein
LPLSHAPGRQGGLSPCRIILDAIDRLSRQPCASGDLTNACGFAKHRLRALELLAAVTRFPALVGPRVSIGLRVRYARALRFLRSLRLRLGRCGHEGDKRVTNGALHGVLSRAVERDAVDHRADDGAPPHELTNGLADVLVVPAEAVNPANNERVAAAEQVEQPAALGSFAELGADSGYATVRDDLVELEACLLGLGSLVFDGLLGGADAGYRTVAIRSLTSPLGLRPLIGRPLTRVR